MDGSGNVVWQWDNTDGFGSTPPNQNPTGQGTFTYNPRMSGQYFDQETNLFYNYFRDYDPSTGRYIESDPIGNVLYKDMAKKNLSSLIASINKDVESQLDSLSPKYNHSYLYGEGNPVSLSDPAGLNPGMGGGTDSCAYYTEMCARSEGRSEYYCRIAPLVCKAPIFPPKWGNCVRQCLQVFDRSCSRNTDGTPNGHCVVEAHLHCWTVCPAPSCPDKTTGTE